ncbi:hypothetical protein ACJX0J_042164, partial [Zea mays]
RAQGHARRFSAQPSVGAAHSSSKAPRWRPHRPSTASHGAAAPWSTCCEICLVALVVGIEPGVHNPFATVSTPAAALYSRCSPRRDLARSRKSRIPSASRASLGLRNVYASSSKPA